LVLALGSSDILISLGASRLKQILRRPRAAPDLPVMARGVLGLLRRSGSSGVFGRHGFAQGGKQEQIASLGIYPVRFGPGRRATKPLIIVA
jgi:hypothetical protein